MGAPQQLLCVSLLGLFFRGLTVRAAEDPPTIAADITLDLQGDLVTLQCNIAPTDENTTWEKDGYPLEMKGNVLHVGSALDDPRGFYTCIGAKKNATLQVFFRMCQYCVHMDVATIAGLLMASVLATVFLAVAVSKIAAPEPGWISQASDKQTLLANDQLYQPLGEHSNGQYSHIGLAKPRRPR